VTPPTVPFPRQLYVGVPQGQDVIAVKRALSRAGFWPWTTFNPYYTHAFAKAVRKFQGSAGDSIYGPITHGKLRHTRRAGHPSEWAFDVVAVDLMHEAYLLQHPGIVSPCKTGYRPSYLHETGGLDGNWALDWMNPGGTAVYAPTGCVVTATGGHDPATGTWKNGRPDRRGDVFGWSLHLGDDNGVRYFGTHLGSLSVRDGDVVKVAQKLGSIGHWPHDPGRSHLHFGCDAGSDVKSRQLILKISAAPRP